MKPEKRMEAFIWTAIVGAYNNGLLDALEKSGHQIVRLLNTRKDVCQDCKLLNGIWFNIRNAKNLLPIHPYCSCTWVIT